MAGALLPEVAAAAAAVDLNRSTMELLPSVAVVAVVAALATPGLLVVVVVSSSGGLE